MSDATPIVLVVDDDPAVRRSTERLLRTAGFAVRTFESAQQFLAEPSPAGPACLVLDVRMPGRSGMQLQKELAGSARRLPIVFVTGHGDIPMAVDAMRAGAVEFLTKPYRKAALLEAIRVALEHDSAGQQSRREANAVHDRYALLTARERQVLALIVRGLLNKQIAVELRTTERTVKFHRANLMRKMSVESVAELVRVAGHVALAAGPVPKNS